VTAAAGKDGAYRRPPYVAFAVDDALDGCRVLLHLPSGRRVSLSTTASDVWVAVVAGGEDGASATDIAPGLADRYGADREQVEQDVRRLLGQLAEADLVELVPWRDP
jgi:hypothetical protein